MPDSKSHTFQLLEDRLGRPLPEEIQRLRDARASWAAIVIHLYRETGVQVSTQTLRNWFPEMKGRVPA